MDFPKIPKSQSTEQFQKMVLLGEKLCKLHLMDHEDINPHKISYMGDGENNVEEVKFSKENNQVYINKSQYFGNVPLISWEFYIGGYQPAQKWLKDRKGRILSDEEIVHYQKIIYVLKETSEMMKQIDKIMT